VDVKSVTWAERPDKSEKEEKLKSLGILSHGPWGLQASIEVKRERLERAH